MAQLQTVSTQETQVLDALMPSWRDFFAPLAWKLYGSLNPDQELFTVKKWFLSYTFRVKDARPVLALLFGEPTV